MRPRDALAFVKRHGVVLEAGRGPVPTLADAIAGTAIRGSWWAHPKAPKIFALTRAVRASPDVLTCRLLQGKVTFVHRRLWPALVRLAPAVGSRPLAAIREEHTRKGAHRIVTTPLPRWVTPEIKIAARRLSRTKAASQLGAWAPIDRRRTPVARRPS